MGKRAFPLPCVSSGDALKFRPYFHFLQKATHRMVVCELTNFLGTLQKTDFYQEKVNR